MNHLIASALSGLLMLASATPASAAAVVYNNEAAFQAATNATLHALAAGANNSASVSTIGGELTLVTASGGMYTDWQTNSGVSRLLGVEMAISGFESFDGNVNLGADRYAFGFGIYESTDASVAGCNTTCVESKFEITLRNNGVDLAPSFFIEPSNDQAVFWGVHTTFAFDSIKIREIVGGNDNEIFGTFYTGLIRASEVPEPGTLLLVGAGLVAAHFRRRRT